MPTIFSRDISISRLLLFAIFVAISLLAHSTPLSLGASHLGKIEETSLSSDHVGEAKKALLSGLSVDHGLSISRPLQPLRIPFRYVNGFLIVDVIINDVLPLSFLFDTGSKHTILTETEMIPLLGQAPQEEILILGSDLKSPITGRIMRGTSLLAGNVDLENQSLIVLYGELMDFKELTGEDVHGILGIGSFGAYALEVDYNRQQIRLMKPSSIKIHKNTTVLPIRVEKSKAYLDVEANIHPGRTQNLSLLIDTGASLSLLVTSSASDSTLFPPKLVTGTFGYGLGGYLLGYVGRSDVINLGPYELPNIITHFQIVTDDSTFKNLPFREGIIGNGVLERYTFTILFNKRELHLRPTKKTKKRPPYDRSGMSLVRDGENLDRFRVQHIVDGSPAYRADIRVGDEILFFRGVPVSFRSLTQTEKVLRGREGKKIKVSIKRNEEVIKKEFTLEKII